jgi:hypothetical protein
MRNSALRGHKSFVGGDQGVERIRKISSVPPEELSTRNRTDASTKAGKSLGTTIEFGLAKSDGRAAATQRSHQRLDPTMLALSLLGSAR